MYERYGRYSRAELFSQLLAVCLTTGLLLCSTALGQGSQTGGSKPPERVIGTVTATDAAAHIIQVKEDKTGAEYTVQLANTRTLLKVEPTAKDLKNAVRITADDLEAGDRVQVGGSKPPDHPNTIVARSVILMSAKDLQRMHQAQAAEWQHSTAGVVTSVDPAEQQLRISARTPEGPKQMVVNVSKAQFTRYSPETPKTPVSSELSDVQPGDQVRVIGDLGPDAETLGARKIYSSSFRTVVGTVSAIASDGKQFTIKDLQTKQPVGVSLDNNSAIHKLPPMMAYALARRFNPDFRKTQAAGSNGEATQDQNMRPGEPAPTGPGAGARWRGGNGAGQGQGTGGGMQGARTGDLSQMLDRLPKISASDLKAGDAVVVSGSPTGTDRSHLLATNVIAGVEPIFQSASPRQAQSLGDWGASLSGGGMDAGMPPQ